LKIEKQLKGKQPTQTKENTIDINDINIDNSAQQEYTPQAEINTKVAALKEGFRKYPRSLIRSEVINNKMFNDTMYQISQQKENFNLDENKISKFDKNSDNIYYQKKSSLSLNTELSNKIKGIMTKLFPAIGDNKIKGKAIIDAMKVLINPNLQSTDTLPHEYAHHYIAWFKNTPIVQEAIKKWGSEEALVQAIGEQVVKQKGEVATWWKKFSKWLKGIMNNLSTKDKNELRDILTNTFLEGTDLITGNKILKERAKILAEDATSGIHYQMDTSLEEDLYDNTELVDDISISILDKLRNEAINNYINRISSLKVAISKTDDKSKKDRFNVRISEMSEQVRNMKNEAKVGIILNAVENTLSGITVDLDNANTALELVAAGEQLNSLDYILKSTLTNKLTPMIENRTTDLQTLVDKQRNKLTRLNQAAVLDHMRSEGYETELEDIIKIKDENVMNSWGRSLNTAKSKLGRAISKAIVKADKSILTTYNEKILSKLNNLIDNLQNNGVNMFDKDIREMLLQRDKNGNLSKNFLNKYSKEYWDFVTKTKGDMRRLSELSRGDRANGAHLRKEMLKLGKELNKNNVMLPPRYFYEQTSSREKESIIAEIEMEIGEIEAKELVRVGQLKYDRYLEKVNNMEQIYYENNAEPTVAEEKLEKWKLYNDPELFLNQFSKGVTMTNIDGMNFVAMMPKKKVNGKDAGWYDKQFNSMMSDTSPKGKAISEFFNFITTTMDEYKKFYPYHLRKEMGSNYLPEIFNELADDARNNVLGAGNLFNKLLNSISESPEFIRKGAIRDASGKLKGEIPAPLTDNKVDKLKRYISILESQIRTKTIKLNRMEMNTDIHSTEAMIAGIKYQKEELSSLNDKLEETKKAYDYAFSHKSTDIIEAFKLFTKGALNYKRKSKVEDMVLLMQTVLNEAEQIETTFLGKDKPEGEYTTFKGGLVNLKKSVDYTIDAILYDKHRAKEANLKKRIGTTPESRAKLKQYKKDGRELYLKLKEGDITKDEFNTKQLQLDDDIAKVRGIKTITGTKLLDTLHSLVYLKSLGWNPFSALANRLNGKLVNSVEAASGEYFNKTHLSKAIKLMRSSVYKATTGKNNKTAHKNRMLINKYGILFAMLETQYGTDKAFEYFKKKAGLLNPMEGQKRVEYINQGEVLLAIMHDTKVMNTLDGKEYNLYEAYDNNGELKEGFDVEAWTSNIDESTTNEFTQLRDKVLALNRKLHGNYDPSNPVLYKKYAIGRALGVFRSWLPEAYASRFASERTDDDLGKQVKGRYLSYAKLVKDEGFVPALMTTTNMLIKSILGKEYKNGAMEEIDLYNMRRNVKELQWLLTTVAMYMLAKAAMPDEEDENKRGYILTLNMITRLQGDMTQYFSPLELSKIANKPFPALSTLVNIIKIVPNAIKATTSDSTRYGYGDWAESVLKEVPLLNIPSKAYSITDKTYN